MFRKTVAYKGEGLKDNIYLNLALSKKNIIFDKKQKNYIKVLFLEKKSFQIVFL